MIRFLAASLVLTLGLTAHAQSAEFTVLSDAGPGKYEPATTKPDVVNPNLLNIGLGTGIIYVGPYPISAAFNGGSDTISIKVKAPAGYNIQSLILRQTGSRRVSRGGVATGSGVMLVDHQAHTITAPSSSKTINLSGKSEAIVSISSHLFTAAGGVASASISIDSSSLEAVLVRVP